MKLGLSYQSVIVTIEMYVRHAKINGLAGTQAQEIDSLDDGLHHFRIVDIESFAIMKCTIKDGGLLYICMAHMPAASWASGEVKGWSSPVLFHSTTEKNNLVRYEEQTNR